MSKRKRKYHLTAAVRGGPFSNRDRLGSGEWLYVVCATSLKQAFYLAKHEIFATDSRSLGIESLETDWWHWLGSVCGESNPKAAEVRGYRIVAPYLRGTP